MNKLTFISLISLGLLLSNVLLAYFLWQKPRPPRPGQQKKVVIERLHFDENQVKQYETLIAKHQDDITETEGKVMTLKTVLYKSLATNGNPLIKDSLINELGKAQIDIENIHYQHFQAIRKLCNEKQLADYDSLTNDIAKIFAKPPIKMPHRK